MADNEKARELLKKAHGRANDILFAFTHKEEMADEVKDFIDQALAALDRPVCKTCGDTKKVTHKVPWSNSSEIRTYPCPDCQPAEGEKQAEAEKFNIENARKRVKTAFEVMEEDITSATCKTILIENLVRLRDACDIINHLRVDKEALKNHIDANRDRIAEQEKKIKIYGTALLEIANGTIVADTIESMKYTANKAINSSFT